MISIVFNLYVCKIAGLFFGRLISVVCWSLRRNKQNDWNAGLYKK